jgi:hypothetical protein
MAVQVVTYREGIQEIIKIEPHWKTYIIIDFAFYLLYVIIAALILRTMTRTNIKTIQRRESWIVLPTFILGCWGFSLLFSPGLNEWKYGIGETPVLNEKELINRRRAYDTLMALTLLRVIIIWITIVTFVLLFVLVGILTGCSRACGSSGSGSRRVDISEKLSNFLKSRARGYDPNAHAGDVEVNECIICFEEFSKTPDKQLVELNCNNKHIFHLECIQKWISNPENKSCPLCREDIQIDGV